MSNGNGEHTFTRHGAKRPAATNPFVNVQWATGLPTKDGRSYAGWFVECGRDDALDAAMEAAGVRVVTIKHTSAAVEHWEVGELDAFVLATGVQSMGEMRNTERYGVAFWWATKNGRPCSFLQVQVLPRLLLEQGYDTPLLLTVSGTVTGDIVAALTRQFEVLDAIDAQRTQQGKAPLDAPFYAASLPIGPGEGVRRGAIQTKEIIQPIAFVPEPIDREYLVAHYIRKEWIPLVEGLIDGAVAWSERRSAQAGRDEDDAQPAL